MKLPSKLVKIMPIPLSERIAVVEEKLDNHDEKVKNLDATIQALNQTLIKTNEALIKLQLSNAFLSGQRKGVYTALCAFSSAGGAGAAMLVEYLCRGHG